jgi:glutaminyl-tRNA synthetase
MSEAAENKSDFIREAVRADLASGRFDRVHTRFPPEPNSYLHIGHALAVWVDYGVARDFGGLFNLRFDDTNPLKEEQEFVDAIVDDVRWLGADFGDRLFFTSDYFEQMFAWAQQLVRQGDAYVCDLSQEEMRATRGTLTAPGTDSPYRGRGVEENLDLLGRMRAGEFPDGAKTLRAKIDMASPNINLRDPVMYRIRHAHHHRQGDKWCIYPSYDWAHGLGDSIEGVTHSLCTMEYEDHRPLYEWFLERLGIYQPRQIEFSRLNLTHTVMSKRRFVELVEGGHVAGYDDPRMPTLAGLRRRGYTPEAVWRFCERAGVSKSPKTMELYQLEDCLREDLNARAARRMAVLDPLRLVLTDYPEGKEEWMEAVNNPESPEAGTRQVPFSREVWIERDDFREEPPPKYHRLAPGAEVRLRYGYVVRCHHVVKAADGSVAEVHCTHDPETRGGNTPDGRKVKGTVHWVSARHATPLRARLYDHLFSEPDPDGAEGGWLAALNAASLQTVEGWGEPALAEAAPGDRFQFERLGYFCADPDSRPGEPVFNRSVTLRDAWAKLQAKS